MDFVGAEKELRKLSDSYAKLARRYAEERNWYGESELEVMFLLVPHQDDRAYQKASYEKQLVMLLGDCPEAEDAVRAMKLSRERYKGLEKMLDQRAARISALQSLMRYAREND